MENLYIILTDDIHPIGGMQIYTAGKAAFLEKRGWKVKIIFQGRNDGHCAQKYLNKFLSGGFPLIEYSPARFSDRTFENAMKKIMRYVNAGDVRFEKIYIESQSDITALWGELIAKKLGGIHFCFNCNEIFRGKLKEYENNIDFFWFKYKRCELAGLRPDTLKKLFEGYYDVPESSEFMFDAVEPDPIQDTLNVKIESICKMDYNILYLGRLNKGYVPNILNGVLEFSKRHLDKNIQLVIVGNPKTRKKEINEIRKLGTNLKIVLTGDLVPIPACLYNKVDVVIAGAVCAEISARMNVPTIVADCENFQANGVLGYTINNSMYFDPMIGQTTFSQGYCTSNFFPKDFIFLTRLRPIHR